MIILIGKDIEITVDLAILQAQPATVEHVWKIGLRNILMDSHASVKRADFSSDSAGVVAWHDSSRALAIKKLEALMKGEIRTNGTNLRAGKSKLDPVIAMARSIARDVVMGQVKNTAQMQKWATSFGLPVKTEDDLKAVTNEAIKRYAAKPDVLAKASEMVEAKNSLRADDLDL